MLSIRDLHAQHRRTQDPEGRQPRGPTRRGARDHGPERLRQEHARERAGGPRGLRGHAGHGRVPAARTCSRMEPEERARAGVFLAFQYPVEIPGRQQRLPAQGGVECDPQAARRVGTRRLRFPRADPRQDEADADGRELPESRRQRRFLGRREEAQRDPADGGARAEARAARRDRLGPRHRCAAGRGERRQQPARAGPRDRAGHALPAPARLHRARLRARARRTARILRSGDKSLALELEKRGYDWVRQEAAVA